MTTIATTDSLRGVVAKAKNVAGVAEALGVHSAPLVRKTEADWPKQIEMTPEAQAAIDALPSVFNQVAPEGPKILTDDELVALYGEREVLRAAMAPLSERDEVIKEIVRHHMDLVAEQANVAVPKDIVRDGQVIAPATPRDSNGHYVIASKGNPERVRIPQTNQAWSREYREGRVNFTDAATDLLDLYEAGEITREEYLAFTRETRVFDETKAMDALRKDPERYVPILARIARRSTDGTSLFVRKA